MSQLKELFGERLYNAAESLAARDVRVLQGGGVITGVVGNARVYVRRTNGKVEGECSCNERSPCVHVVAVVIAADRTPTVRPQAATPSAPGAVGNQQQRLAYLLTPAAAPSSSSSHSSSSHSSPAHSSPAPSLPASAGIDVCVWVGSLPFSSRPQHDYPRYVQPNDKAILKALTTGQIPLSDIITTGRAYWQSLTSQPLRAGAPRQVPFAWTTKPNGDQELTCPVVALLDLDPPVYVDPKTAEVGRLESPHSLALVREFWQKPPITPEQLDTIPHAPDFPTPQTFQVAPRPLASLSPRLTLSSATTSASMPSAASLPAAPAATLYFVYNNLPVDSTRLHDDTTAVRQLSDSVLYEIPRDLQREREFRAKLAAVLPGTAQDREAWLQFVLEARPALEADGWQVDIADNFPYRLATTGDWYGDLDNDQRKGWFNLRLGVVVDGQHVNLLPALTRYLQSTLSLSDTDAPPTALGNEGCRVGNQWLVLLDDGRYLPVPLERIQRIADTLVELFDSNALTKLQTLSLPRSHAARIAQLARDLDGSSPNTRDLNSPSPNGRAQNGPTLRAATPGLQALLDDLMASGDSRSLVFGALAAPPGFLAELRPYQQEGLGWLQFLRKHHLGGILADDMGLGKTVQTLAHLTLEKRAGRLNRPCLIVAPVSTLGNWQQELHRFAPELTGLVLHGSRRRESFGLIDKVDVVITGYPLLQLDSEILLAKDYYLVILDEAQTIKNPKAKVSTTARALRSEHRLALTGTPVENHLGELWSLFDFAQPGLLGEERLFQRQFRTPIEKDGNRMRSQALAQRVAPFLLRRTKDAVAKDLPPKTEIVETLALEEKQRDFYDGIRLAGHRHIQEVVQQQGLARSQITILDALLKLRQACCDPRLLAAAAAKEDIPSAKLDWLSSALPELIAEGRRVLLFSQFTSMLRLIEQTVTALGIPYCLLTGATQNRTAVIQRFQTGAVPLFLISLKAGGTGLNLTAADTVIHYDPWWNPAVEAQATDRAHRIGQDKPVFVYKLIAQGTVEERIIELQADKHALASRLYTDAAGSPDAETTGSSSSLTTADIEALFAP